MGKSAFISLRNDISHEGSIGLLDLTGLVGSA